MKRAVLLALAVAGCAHAPAAIAPVPSSVQSDAIIGWKQYQLPYGGFGDCNVVLGHDGMLYTDTYQGVIKVDTLGNATLIPVNGQAIGSELVASNPDGNVYVELPNNDLAQITPQGQVNNFDIPFEGPMITGSNGNLWVIFNSGIESGVEQIWTSGVIGSNVERTGGPYQGAQSIVRGPDKNLWALAAVNNAPSIVHISVADMSQTVYPAPSDMFDLVQGTDGNLYAGGSTGMYRVNMDGSVTSLPSSPHPNSRYSGDAPLIAGQGRIWWTNVRQRVLRVYGWSVRTHKVGTIVQAPEAIVAWAFGADHNLWTFNDNNTGTANVLQFSK